jgi:signal transduction histidine kinase/DNA-binding response OmpR family regulator
MLAAEPWAGEAFQIFGVVLGFVLASYWLQARYSTIAASVYVLGMSISVTMIAFWLSGIASLYVFILILPITAMLMGQHAIWASAGAVLILAFGVARRTQAPMGDVVAFVGSVGITAFALWLSSRRLYTALDWALCMMRESRKNAREARERRAEVRRILGSLEEACVRLEKANQALILAREAAEKAYQFKADFVANVSHELRTPLNLIVGFSEMMATAPESYRGVVLPSEYRGDILAVYRSACHLSELINDVLDLAQIEGGRLPLSREPTDLAEVVREAVNMVRGLAEAKGLRLEVDLPESLPPMFLDRTRIRQVLLNLLSNATRFTDSGSVRVHVSLMENEARVMVEDSGRGIAPDKLVQAFQAFSQLDEDLARRGAGLGLALSKRFVELHGGTMVIESVLGRGTKVVFSLPLPEESSYQPLVLVKSAQAPGHDQQPRVLVLHDDRRVLSLLRRHIEGFQFVMADSVASAVGLIAEMTPVAMIIEAGWAERWAEVASKADLQANLPVLTIPLLNLRAYGLTLGADDYLAKPITREDLATALDRLPRRPRTVLIIDDDRQFLRLLARLLTASDPALRVLEASGANEGLGLARAHRPDLILLDMKMPEVSGQDFLEERKAHESLAATPVIIMSAHATEGQTATTKGELRLGRAEGLSLTEILLTTRSVLTALTQPDAVDRASVQALPADAPESPAC